MELPSQSWSAATCSSLGQRDLLARFWLSCPDDLLESCWNSPLGQSTCDLVRQLTPETSFNSEQIALRQAIGTRLQAGFQIPCAVQLCLANWLLSPPGLMRVANPEANLPSWLLQSYLDLYDSLRKKGLDDEASDFLDNYKNNIVDFTKKYKKDFRKLM